ncbi:hypothetical protein [Nitrosopumilus sp.]|uniref:hypothetical protein n=1 Tax=Nitrosopumilus sp. TaxID=2024843 RepID=UPI00262B2F89|nr:hypothetical protein [Nitrosopumilus sp.]
MNQVWEEFPQLEEWHNLDNSNLPKWKLEQFIDAGYHNFVAERKPLYNLSKMIEKYAQEHNEPLLATFEKIARFSFVKKRYQVMAKEIPKLWIVADYDKSIPNKELIPNAKFLSCKNTNLANVWTVITRGPYGPFGLIAEEFEDGKFRGFFTLNSNVCRYALQVMGKTLGTKFTIQ